MEMEQAFLRLDPVLRLLLASIRRYQELSQGTVTAQNNDISQSELLVGSSGSLESEERLISLLKAQFALVDTLQSDLKELKSQFGSVLDLSLLSEYILLPLLAIISSYSRVKPSNPVHQSALWKCIQSAATCLEAYTCILGSSTLASKQIVDCLSGSIQSLQTIETTCVTLDKGEECVKSLLSCIEALVRHAALVGHDDSIESSLQKGMLVTLVDKCMSIVKPGHDRRQDSSLLLQTLATLDCLLTFFPLVDLWRSSFPGCFVPLYQLVISNQSPSEVSARALHSLTLLLGVTTKSETGQIEATESPIDLLQKIQTMCIEKQKSDSIEPVEAQETRKSFRDEANLRLPATFTVLLNVLPTTSSPKLRRAVSSLCRTMLLDMRGIWNANNLAAMENAAIECCLVLTYDSDEETSTNARNVLEEYRQSLGDLSWKNRVVESIVPRLVALLEDIPILVTRKKEVELRAKLKLITGYFDVVQTCSSLESAVATEEVIVVLKNAFSVLFDIDFDSIQLSPSVLSVKELDQTEVSSSEGTNRLRFRFMSEQTADTARTMVKAFVQAIDQNRATIFIDALFAEVFESCVGAVDNGASLVGSGQLTWLHERIGAVVVSREILHGLCWTKSDSSSGTTKEHRKHKRKWKAFAEAILPLITSPPLWNLPTSSPHDTLSSGEDNGVSQALALRMATREGESQIVSASSLRGNATLACYLIEVIGSMVRLLGKVTETFIPVILFPLFEKAAQTNHSQVQQTAVQALCQISVTCGFESIANMISANFDYLFGTLKLKLRVPGGGSIGGMVFPRDLAGVAAIILKSAISIESECDEVGRPIPKRRTMFDESNVSLVIEVLNTFTLLNDRTMYRIVNPRDQAALLLETIELYKAAIDYLLFTFGLSNRLNLAPEKTKASGDTFLNVLEPFRLRESTHTGLKFLQGQEKEDVEETKDDEMAEMNVSSGEIDFLNTVAARCTYSLSIQSLRVQVAACRTLEAVFGFLGWVAVFYKVDKDSEETNTHDSAILRQIYDSWPAVTGRIRQLVLDITNDGRASLSLQTMQPVLQSHPSASNYPHLSHLIDLVASMCEVSGGFAAAKVKEELWPLFAKLLEMFLRRKVSFDATKPTPEENRVIKGGVDLTEEDKLLVAVLRFFSRVYSSEEAAKRLFPLIEAAGTMVLPFVDVPGPVGEEAMNALKKMLSVDCDSMMRALITTSGHSIPDRWIEPEKWSTRTPVTALPPSALQSRARELLAYVDGLPEQSIKI